MRQRTRPEWHTMLLVTANYPHGQRGQASTHPCYSAIFHIVTIGQEESPRATVLLCWCRGPDGLLSFRGLAGRLEVFGSGPPRVEVSTSSHHNVTTIASICCRHAADELLSCASSKYPATSVKNQSSFTPAVASRNVTSLGH